MITSALCNSYKSEILRGTHQPGHNYKVALYAAKAELSKDTRSYTATGELIGGRGYTSGGIVLQGFNVSLNGDSAYLTFDNDAQWPNASFTCRGCLIYNASLPGLNAVAVYDFGKEYGVTNMRFVLPFPKELIGIK